MANIKEIKQRITSVKKTKKMTAAMKMVAAAKFKRALKSLRLRLEYTDALTNIKTNLLSGLEGEILPYQLTENGSPTELVVVFSSDRGLCGGFNTNLLKRVDAYLAAAKHPIEMVLIGNKAQTYFKSKNAKFRFQRSQFQAPLFLGIDAVLNDSILKPLQNKEIGKVTLAYNRFINALTSEIEFEALLPILPTPSETQASGPDFFFEPSKFQFLGDFIDAYLAMRLANAAMNTSTGEEGARMSAMDSASQNASDMIGDLTLLFNRTRQAAITTELTEIVGGAAALTQ